MIAGLMATCFMAAVAKSHDDVDNGNKEKQLLSLGSLPAEEHQQCITAAEKHVGIGNTKPGQDCTAKMGKQDVHVQDEKVLPLARNLG